MSIVYLDVCCLKRPFDDQRATRIQLETAAVATLIGRAERGELRLVRSPAHTFENDRNPREGQRHSDKLRVSITNPTQLLQKLAGGEP